jgi:hypothetical protein
MIRFLLIVGLILYVVYKIGTLFFRAGAASQQQYRNPPSQHHTQNTNGAKKKESAHSNFKGGEYIDYEEIK